MIKLVKKSLTSGYSAAEVNEVLNEYLDEFSVDAMTLVMLYELMPTELFDGIRTALEDEFDEFNEYNGFMSNEFNEFGWF